MVVSLKPSIRHQKEILECAECGAPYELGSVWRCADCTKLLRPCDTCSFWQAPSNFDDDSASCKACVKWKSVSHPAYSSEFWFGMYLEWEEDPYTAQENRFKRRKFYSHLREYPEHESTD